MPIKIKEQSPSRLVIETPRWFLGGKFLLYTTAFLLFAIIGSIWLYNVGIQIALYCLCLTSIMFVISLHYLIEEITETAKKKSMVVTIDIDAGLVQVTGSSDNEIPGRTTKLKIDSVRYIELTWEDPRFFDVNLALRGLDGSCLFIGSGDAAAINVLAEKVQKLLNKPINNMEIKTNPFFESKENMHLQ